MSLQVYLPAIEGYVPQEMIHTLRTFMDFCYLARQEVHDTKSLELLDNAWRRFHKYRTIFQTSGVQPTGFNLPWQHSMVHYVNLIHTFGAPNGLCSSITESKHIKAIKEPWQQSSHFNALRQMLLTNQQLDKLAACHVDFTHHEMLEGSCYSQYA
jgi:hypothetical protein